MSRVPRVEVDDDADDRDDEARSEDEVDEQDELDLQDELADILQDVPSDFFAEQGCELGNPRSSPSAPHWIARFRLHPSVL